MDDSASATRDHANDLAKKSKKADSEKSRKDRSPPEIVLIDSDSDEQSDFKPSKLNLRMPKSDLPEEDVGNFELWSSEDENSNASDVSDKEKIRTDSVKREETWSCRLCTFLNHNQLRICEMCNSPKVKKNTSVAKSSGKRQRCKVSLGMTQSQVDSKVNVAEKIEVLGDDSVRCLFGNGGEAEKLCAVVNPGVTPAASCTSVGGLSPEGHNNIDRSDFGESAGDRGESTGSETGQFSELDSLQMSDLSEGDIDASEDKFDACCRLLTDDSQKSKDGENDGVSHDAAGATPVRRTLGKEQRKLRDDRKCYLNRDHEMSDSSNDSTDVSLVSYSNEASGKCENENNILGRGKSPLDARKEHNTSDSSGVCQQEPDTRTVTVDPALVSNANSDVCKDVHRDHPRTEGSITIDRCDESSDVRDEGSLTQEGGGRHVYGFLMW